MKKKIRAIKEALTNILQIKNIIEKQVQKQLRIQEISKNVHLLNNKGVTTSLYNGKELIITLTTYNKRIFQVHLAIESLLEQTLKPNRIILWLDKNEFSHENLPLNLLTLENRGLQIEFCENIRSYKKLIPTLLKYPHAIPITADDDIIYPEDFVERLYKAYLKDPSKIYFYRGHKMNIINGYIQPYNTWKLETSLTDDSFHNFPTTGGGVLYPEGTLDKEVTNAKVFMSICPWADDVWFKAMSLKAGSKCQQIQLECPFREKFYFMDTMDDISLARINQLGNQNDPQIKSVFEKYKLYEKFKEA
jgi:hypothetical protein